MTLSRRALLIGAAGPVFNALLPGGRPVAISIFPPGPDEVNRAGDSMTGSLTLQSTFAGGENTTDSTSRIYLQSHQRAQGANSFGEVVRIDLMRSNAKAMLTWRDNFTTPGSPRIVAWVGAHAAANDGLSWHNHISLEVPDTNGELQTRLEIPYGPAVSGGFGTDHTNIQTHQADFTVEGGRLRLGGLSAGQGGAVLEFATSADNEDTTNRRVRVQTDSTAWDLRVRVYDDAGANPTDVAVFERLGKRVRLGDGPGHAPRLHVFGTGGTVAQIERSASGAAGVFKVLSAATTDPVIQGSLPADSSSRFSVRADGQIGFGDGRSRDVTLERGGTAQLKVTPLANASASSSVGGALNITNTASSGAGLVVYSANAAPSGHLIIARANHAAFNRNAVYVEYVGTSHAVAINHSGTGGASSALNVSSTNDFSAMQLSGVETATGTLKLTHTGTGTDGSAAAISINLAGAGTASQGIFLTGATTGDLLKLVNSSVIQFSVGANGDLLVNGALNHDGSTAGFYGTAPVTKRTVSGSRGGNAALASLITALAQLGLLTDTSTA